MNDRYLSFVRTIIESTYGLEHVWYGLVRMIRQENGAKPSQATPEQSERNKLISIHLFYFTRMPGSLETLVPNCDSPANLFTIDRKSNNFFSRRAIPDNIPSLER